MAYIKKHWCGEFSLSISFWINVVLINVGIRITQTWLTKYSPFENPILASRAIIVFFVFSIFLVYPWQIIGLWRSADRHSTETQKRFWPGLAKGLIVLSLIGIMANLNVSWPVYRDLFKIGVGIDKYSHFKVELINDSSLIHVEGPLGFGVSKKVEKLIKSNPAIKGIVLDSVGGRLYEGRALSRIIYNNHLDTYTLSGCYSACCTAFISGKSRYIAKGANLAFHQYHVMEEGLDPYVDVQLEQKEDLTIFKKQGISQDFIDRIFSAKQDDLWYPTIDEMLVAGVIHDIVNPSTLKPFTISSVDIKEIDEGLQEINAFQAIKRFDPKLYQQILEDVKNQLKNGTSHLEMQQISAKYIRIIANKTMPVTSDKAILKFFRELVEVLKLLDEKDPFLCVKYLFPQRYGTVDVTRYLTDKEILPILDALNRIIVDSYMGQSPEIDTNAAEALTDRVYEQLGDNALFIENQRLQNREEYSKACKGAIRFYELILAYDEKVAANGLRYLLSSGLSSE